MYPVTHLFYNLGMAPPALTTPHIHAIVPTQFKYLLVIPLFRDDLCIVLRPTDRTHAFPPYDRDCRAIPSGTSL